MKIYSDLSIDCEPARDVFERVNGKVTEDEVDFVCKGAGNGRKRLSSGVIVGIVVGVCVFMGCLVGVIWWFCSFKKERMMREERKDLLSPGATEGGSSVELRDHDWDERLNYETGAGIEMQRRSLSSAKTDVCQGWS